MASGVELGTAWINVAPSFRGFRQAVSKELGGVQVAPHASGWARTIDSKISGAFRTVGKTAAVTFAAAGGALSAGLNAGIKRADILHSFPKQMKNLGYSATEARAAIEKMSDKLLGLPTSVDALAGVTMKFAPLTGSLAEATDLSLALNNAILAGGKSMDVQTNALEQYSQMLAVGKVDMQAWRSMVTAMPGQMDQLSQSILGVGHNSMDLYEAMKSGEVTFDDFNKALLDLNENGLAGYASFSQQAIDATAGIDTALQNVKTALARGKAKIIDAIGYEDIVKVINGFGEEIGKAHDKVADFITVAKDADKTGRSLQDRLGEMAAGFGLLAGAITVGSKWEFISGLSSQVDQVAKSFNVFDRLPARVGASFRSVSKHSGKLSGALDLLRGKSSESAQAITDSLSKITGVFKKKKIEFPSIRNALKNFTVPDESAVQDFANSLNASMGKVRITSGFAGLKADISSAFSGLLGKTGPLASKMKTAWGTLSHVTSSGVQSVGGALEKAAGFLGGKSDALAPAVESGMGKVGKSVTGRLKSIDGVLGGFSGKIGGHVRNIAGGFRQMLPQISASLAPLAPAVQSGMGRVGSALQTTTSGVFASMASFFSPGRFLKLFAFGAIFAGLIAGIGAFASQAGGELTTVIADITGKIPGMLAQATTAMTTTIPQFFNAGVELVLAVGQAIVTALPGLVDAAGQMITTLVSGLAGAAPQLLSMAAQVIATLVSGIGAALPGMVAAGVELLASLADGLASNIGLLVGAAGDLIGGLLNALTSSMGDFVTAGTSVLQGLVDGILQALPQLMTAIPQIITQIATALTTALPQLWNTGVQILTGLIDGIVQALPQLAAMLPQVITTIMTTLTTLLPQLLQAGITLLQSLIQGIVQAIPIIIPAILQVITGIINSIVSMLPMIIEGGLQILMSLIDGIIQAIPQLAAQVPTIITTIVTVLADNLPAIIDAAIQIIVGLITGLTNALPQLIAMVPQIIVSIVTTLIQNLPQILSAGVQIITSLVKGIVSMFGSIISTAAGIPGKVLQGLGNVGSMLWNSGASIVSGFLGGIKSMWGNVTSWVNGALSTVRNLFPFSPAKEGPFSGRGWVLYSGQSIGEAFAQGIRDRAGLARRAAFGVLDEAKQQLESPINAGFAFSTRGSSGLRPAFASDNSTYNVHVAFAAEDLRRYSDVADFFERGLRPAVRSAIGVN